MSFSIWRTFCETDGPCCSDPPLAALVANANVAAVASAPAHVTASSA
jgi:hypothetical protein